ncbi:MAG: iron-containing alcohol dehydrogenase [bacterium]|nr:iron-containing alcohol dehydrogenase [bacterium]
MENFNYFQPTEIRFGAGRVNEIGEIVARYGKNVLMVTTPSTPDLQPIYDRVKSLLRNAGLEVEHFDRVQPNPTVDNISAGAEMAVTHKADVIVGLGGGSSMDSAKAIAVEASHEGSSWDYLWYSSNQPTEKTLPVIAVSTTSGTGSQVTQVAVVTNSEERCKSAIYNPVIYPKAAVVDPELMVSVPKHITAVTGFDIFCHSFESWIHVNTSPYIEMMAQESIKLVIKNLPEAIKDGSNIAARKDLAWADTLAGLCISNAGVTLPHGMSMAIGGMYPHIAHAEALALVYPEFMRYTWQSEIAKFAGLGRIINPELCSETDEIAAEKSCLQMDDFLKDIGLWFGLENFKVPEEELNELGEACLVLPDYKNNPKIADLNDIMDILQKSYSR